MRKFFCIGVLATLAAFAASAQALPSLLIPSEAASLGVGGASVARSASAYALDNNAAAMALSDRTLAAGVSYALWQPSVAKENLLGVGAYWHTGRLGLGLGFKRFGMPSYEVVSPNGSVSQIDGAFTPSDMSFALGGAFAVIDGLSVGVTARLTLSTLSASAKATVFGADLSVMYAREALRAGLVVANLGGGVRYSETSYPQPMQVRAGAGYTFLDCLSVDAELSYLFAGAFGAALGVEYSFRDMVFGRAGFHYGNPSLGLPTYVSLGLGGKFAGISLDAAYLLVGPLGNSLLFTLGYSF